MKINYLYIKLNNNETFYIDIENFVNNSKDELENILKQIEYNRDSFELSGTNKIKSTRKMPSQVNYEIKGTGGLMLYLDTFLTSIHITFPKNKGIDISSFDKYLKIKVNNDKENLSIGDFIPLVKSSYEKEIFELGDFGKYYRYSLDYNNGIEIFMEETLNGIPDHIAITDTKFRYL